MQLSSKTIAVLGSSSVGEDGVGTLGRALFSELSSSDVRFNAKVGRGLAGAATNRLVGTLYQRRELQDWLTENRPDIILVVLGGNPPGSDAEMLDGAAFLSKLSAALGAELYWVGPPVYSDPSLQQITNRYDLLIPQVLGSKYQSSQAWTSTSEGRTADRVHFTQSGANSWASRIVGWLSASSSQPSAPGSSTVVFGVIAALAIVWAWSRRKK